MSQIINNSRYTAENYIEFSKEIYDFIEKNRIDSQKGVTYAVNPEGPVDLTGGPVHGKYSLYSGSAGIGIYLLQLYDTTNEEKFLEEAKLVANEIIEKVPGSEFYEDKYQNALDSSLKVIGWHTGFYSGPIGAGFFILALYDHLKDEKYLDFAIRLHEDLVKTARKSDKGIYFSGDVDLFSDAGYILYEIELFKKTSDKKYLNTAQDITDYIINSAIKDANGNIFWKANDLSKVGMPDGSIYPGLSHGSAGIAYAIATLYEYDSDSVKLEVAKSASEFLLSIADEVGDGILIPYLYTENEVDKAAWQGKYYAGFCHGPAGTALLYYKLYKITKEDKYLKIVKKLSQGILELNAPELNSWGLWDSKCWCCGTPGLIEHFTWMSEITGDDKYLLYAKRSAARVIADSFKNADGTRSFYGYWDRTNPRGVETYTGLYIGAAGAGAALLKLYARETEKEITPIVEYRYL